MPTQSDYALLDTKTHLPEAERHYQAQSVGKLDFENQPIDAATGISADIGYYSKQSFHADDVHAYGPALTIKLQDANLQPGQYVRASCRVFSDYGAWGNKLVMSIERDGKSLLWEGVRLQNNLSVNRAWNQVYFDAPLPADALPTDQLKVYVLSENGASCYVDDVQAERMQPNAGW